MEKPHNVRYSLIAFLIFSILVPILLSDVNLLGNKGELYMEYWIFSVLALIQQRPQLCHLVYLWTLPFSNRLHS